MERIDTSAVAHAILDAPGWARVGITAPSSCLREDAAHELARVIADAVDAPAPLTSPEQSSLPLSPRASSDGRLRQQRFDLGIERKPETSGDLGGVFEVVRTDAQ